MCPPCVSPVWPSQDTAGLRAKAPCFNLPLTPNILVGPVSANYAGQDPANAEAVCLSLGILASCLGSLLLLKQENKGWPNYTVFYPITTCFLYHLFVKFLLDRNWDRKELIVLRINVFYSIINSEKRVTRKIPLKKEAGEKSRRDCNFLVLLSCLVSLFLAFCSLLFWPYPTNLFGVNVCHYRLGGRKEDYLLIQTKSEAISCAKTDHLPALANRTVFESDRIWLAYWMQETRWCVMLINWPHTANPATSVPCDIFKSIWPNSAFR